MFARLLAAFCLLHLAAGMSRASSDGPANSELVVYLRAPSTRAVEYMKREMTPLMGTAGFQVRWSAAETVESTGALAVVELRGACAIPAGNSLPDAAADNELASTSASENRVLPFISMNCSALTQLLAPALSAEAGARRDYLYGRAMARVLAHELYHVLANTREHSREGIGKPAFTAADLLGERFEFEGATRARMESPAATLSEVPSGR